MKRLFRWLGYFVYGIAHKIKNKNLIIEYGAKATKESKFEGSNKLSHDSFFAGEMGFASYIGANSVVCGKIGRFCSIAERVVFLTKTHPVEEFVSTHPCFYSLKKQSGFTYVKKQLFDECPVINDSNFSIEVGNDVYIGFGAIVIGPCRIGDGAVIAAGAVVTGNVPDYAIVGGVPAKIIRYRFNDDEMNFLKNLKWWNKDRKWLADYAKHFISIEQLKNALKT